MLENLSIVSFTIFIIVFVYLVAKLITQSNQNKNIKIQMVRLAQELAILKNLLDEKEKLASDKNDGFVKFISDSRDSAFEYIENAQQVINKIINDTELTINYHNQFRSMEIEPYQSQLDTLTNAIEELKALIPKEEL